MNAFRTEQEEFWAGDFGNNYIDRNSSAHQLSANISLFSKALQAAVGVGSIIELRANIGQNLKVLSTLLPKAQLSAVEINEKAVGELKSLHLGLTVFHDSILNFKAEETWDMAFTKGVLIHMDPQYLPHVYDTLLNCARRYILVAEYYNPKPVEVNYRGRSKRLFKRDFAGEMLDRFPSLELLDYGFVYHRDHNSTLDDITWSLMKKTLK